MWQGPNPRQGKAAEARMIVDKNEHTSLKGLKLM